jgi:hypothetical protein
VRSPTRRTGARCEAANRGEGPRGRAPRAGNRPGLSSPPDGEVGGSGRRRYREPPPPERPAPYPPLSYEPASLALRARGVPPRRRAKGRRALVASSMPPPVPTTPTPASAEAVGGPAVVSRGSAARSSGAHGATGAADAPAGARPPCVIRGFPKNTCDTAPDSGGAQVSKGCGSPHSALHGSLGVSAVAWTRHPCARARRSSRCVSTIGTGCVCRHPGRCLWRDCLLLCARGPEEHGRLARS